MRRNVLVDLTIAILRALLNRLLLWRMERVRAPELLTPQDAFDYANRMIDELQCEEDEDGFITGIITARREDDEPWGIPGDY